MIDQQYRGQESKECAKCGATFSRDKRCTWSHWERAKFCSRQCASAHGGAIARSAIPPIDVHFWTFVDVRGEDDCWPWLGGTDKDGYGCFGYHRRMYRAPRLAIELSGREVPKGHHACHTCHNPSCVNPGHLYAGTAKQNNADKRQNGTHYAGEMCPASKLTAEQVKLIRQDARAAKHIAADYGVSAANISMIKRRRTWRDVA